MYLYAYTKIETVHCQLNTFLALNLNQKNTIIAEGDLKFVDYFRNKKKKDDFIQQMYLNSLAILLLKNT